MARFTALATALTILLLSAAATGLPAGRDDASQAKAEIDALMTSWHKAAATADAKTYFGLMAPGSVFLGTDATERWTKEEFEKYAASRFKGGSAWVYWATERNIGLAADGTTAWVDETLASKSYWTCRGTAALEKIGGAWKIRLYSLTYTIPNSAVREIMPVVKRELDKSPKK
jgi:ketosteroid isomerase-like protein